MNKNIIIIGSGPAGYPCALKLKELGANVTIIEKGNFGGTCLNRGCIPSKSYLDAGHRVHSLEILKSLLKDDQELNFNTSMLSWDKIKQRKTDVIGKLRTSLEKMMQMKKVEIIKGKASFESANKVKIQTAQGEVTKEFDYAVIATGTNPSFPPPFADFKNKLLDSDRIFDIPKLPKSLAIIGGGVIGLEFACFFNSMGTDVSVIELMPNILPGEDAMVTRALKTSFEKRGIKFYLGKKTETLEIADDKKTLNLDDGTKIEVEEILVGTGRSADLKDLNLEALKLEHNNRGLKVNDLLQTEIENIYAIGDINGISLLAHSATKQGEIAAENIMGAKKTFDSNIVPKCIYTWPEVASIGLNKSEADAKGIEAKTQRNYFNFSGKALTTEAAEGFVQIVYNTTDDSIIGAQIVGQSATELIHIIAVAIKFKLKRSDMKELIYAHPTMAEGIGEALNK
ncbi:MAG: dihydrolipoyl dehydrogenase [Elusimicrobiales bacterium]|nr:dihydrolipoyl dehydrogenase [Elusimicrobiales bacterium]